MALYKNVLKAVLILSLTLSLLGCSNTKNEIDYDFKINDVEYVLNEDGNGYEEIDVSSGDKITVILPHGEVRFEWLIHPSIGYGAVEKEVIELYEYDGVEGSSNLADQLVFEIDVDQVIEIKKINKNITEDFDEEDYQNLSEADYNAMDKESLVKIKIVCD